MTTINQLHQTLDRLVLLDLPTGADPLLTDRQLCALMGISLQTLRRKRVRGEFPMPVKISPKRHGTRLSEYKAFLQQSGARDHARVPNGTPAPSASNPYSPLK